MEQRRGELSFTDCQPRSSLLSYFPWGVGLGEGLSTPSGQFLPSSKYMWDTDVQKTVRESPSDELPAGVMHGDLVGGLHDRAAMSPQGLEFPCPGQEDGKGLPVGVATLTPGQETTFLLAPWWARCILPAQEGPPPSPLG